MALIPFLFPVLNYLPLLKPMLPIQLLPNFMIRLAQPSWGRMPILLTILLILIIVLFLIVQILAQFHYLCHKHIIWTLQVLMSVLREHILPIRTLWVPRPLLVSLVLLLQILSLSIPNLILPILDLN